MTFSMPLGLSHRPRQHVYPNSPLGESLRLTALTKLSEKVLREPLSRYVLKGSSMRPWIPLFGSSYQHLFSLWRASRYHKSVIIPVPRIKAPCRRTVCSQINHWNWYYWALTQVVFLSPSAVKRVIMISWHNLNAHCSTIVAISIARSTDLVGELP